MTRKAFVALLGLGSPFAFCEDDAVVRGKLLPGKLELAGGKMVILEGDGPTLGVVRDPRLAGRDFEAVGRREGADRFVIGPIHTKSMFIHRDGKKLYITYWCELCAIRTYTPGVCACCQEETALDLREKPD